jgi:DNA-binding NarL/FixJ family response regulator
VRVIICEDHALVRDGLERLLASHGFDVAASVDSAGAFLAAVKREHPDVCVVDVRLPPSFTDEGIRAAIEARRQVPGLPILILSQYVEQTYARELLTGGEGGVGYLLKDRVADPKQFVDAVRRVADGGTALDPEAVARLLGRPDRQGRLELLTPREREVLSMMAEGRSNNSIAEQMVITDRAVEKHVSNIFWKLDLPATGKDHRRVLAVLAWLQAGE